MAHIPFVVGVTGGIGSGKSVVSRLLRLMGVPVYDCDAEAKHLMAESLSLRTELIALAGTEVYTPSGRLNRSYLASYMFGNPDRVALVNGIVHPAVRTDFLAWKASYECPVVAVESAILFESKMDILTDAVLLVHASEEVRVQRAMLRDGVDEASVRRRMASQTDHASLMVRATHIVYNDEAHSLLKQVAELLDDITKSLSETSLAL